MFVRDTNFRRQDNSTEKFFKEEVLEHQVRDACLSNHVVSCYLLIISNLLISFDKDNVNKNKALKLLSTLYKDRIHNLLNNLMNKRQSQTGQVLEAFYEQLSKIENVESLDFDNNGEERKNYLPFTDKTDLLININELHYHSAGDDSQSSLTSWKPEKQRVFRKNLYAYGRSFVLDKNEMFYMMKANYYESQYINTFISVLTRYNLEMSLVDSERYLVSNIHDQFAFIASLGHDGFLGSSHDKIPTSIKQNSNDVNYGFSQFTLVGAKGTRISRKEFNTFKDRLISNVSEFATRIWNSIKDDLTVYNQTYLDINGVVGKSFGQKLSFFKTIFHNMIYLGGLEYSEIETFEGGSHSRDYSEERKGHNFDMNEDNPKSRIVNISADIITKLEELLYFRTRFTSDLPTEELLLENMLEFVPIFFNNVIENQILTESREAKLFEHIIAVAKQLRLILDYKNDKYYDSVVLIYEQLLKVLDDKFEIKGLFTMKDSVVIKKMMSKITQDDCTESQYLSTLKFMIAYSSTPEGALHLFDERVIQALIHSHCLKNLDDHEYYEIKERNTKHILWLWTLHLMRQMTSMLIQNSEFTYVLINFIVSFEKRIMTTLQFKGYIDGKKQFKSFSIAKLEEIEHIVNLMAFCLQNYDQWKEQRQDQLETLVNILFSYTVNLFQSNVTLNDCFHPISQFEKYINNLTDGGDSGSRPGDLGDTELVNQSSAGSFSSISQTDKNFMKDKIVTSLRTPAKGEAYEQNFRMFQNDQYSKRAYKSTSLVNYMTGKYKPTAFILKVEVTLSKIALMMLKCMYLILKEEIKLGSRSHFVKELSYYHEVSNETRIFLVCANIFDVIQFSFHCQGKWTSDFESVRRLSKVLSGAYLSSENTMESILDMEDVIQISQSTTELGLMLSSMLLKASQLSREESLDKNYLEIADQRLVNKIKSYTEDWRRMKEENKEVSPKKTVSRSLIK